MKKALIVWGGWPGHFPEQVARLFRDQLVERGFQVDVSDSLDIFRDADALQRMHLVVPVVTMSTVEPEQLNPLLEAVKNGLGIAGCHGGMGDSFRNSTEWQFLVGGQFVAHPGDDGLRHRVEIRDPDHVITRGLEDFDVETEQYYMHVDPAIQVLATTTFPVADGPHVPNGPVKMPVVWTKLYGKGRVFYSSLGHSPEVLQLPPVQEIMTRGMGWAARD